MQWKPSYQRISIAVCTSIAAVAIIILWPSRERPVVQPICTRLQKVIIKGRRPAFAPNYKLQWDNPRKLTVFFMDGAKPINKMVLASANIWATYCGIRFDSCTKSYESQIRVTFKSGGYASAVGLECVQDEYKAQPTMFLEGLDTMKNKQEFTRIVLHEFGHALGLEHEMRKETARVPWDSPAVYKYYADHYKWKPREVNNNIFNTFQVPKPYDEFDTTSIMIYAIPDTLTIGKYQINWPAGLSSTDKKFIAQWYPKQ